MVLYIFFINRDDERCSYTQIHFKEKRRERQRETDRDRGRRRGTRNYYISRVSAVSHGVVRVQNKFGNGVVLRKLLMVILIVGARGHGQRRQVCTVYILFVCVISCVCVWSRIH